jgi:hypothetical protein
LWFPFVLQGKCWNCILKYTTYTFTVSCVKVNFILHNHPTVWHYITIKLAGVEFFLRS